MPTGCSLVWPQMFKVNRNGIIALVKDAKDGFPKVCLRLSVANDGCSVARLSPPSVNNRHSEVRSLPQFVGERSSAVCAWPPFAKDEHSEQSNLGTESNMQGYDNEQSPSHVPHSQFSILHYRTTITSPLNSTTSSSRNSTSAVQAKTAPCMSLPLKVPSQPIPGLFGAKSYSSKTCSPQRL